MSETFQLLQIALMGIGIIVGIVCLIMYKQSQTKRYW